MKRCEHATRFALLAAVAVAAPAALAAQDAVPTHQEPRHRLKLETPDFRVLDIEIQPGDTTLYHIHDLPLAYVYVSPAAVITQTLGGEWSTSSGEPPRTPLGFVTWSEGYAENPRTHRVSNVDARGTPFRLIGVMHRGDGDTAPGDAGMLGSAGEVERSGRWFRSARTTIGAGTEFEWAAHDRTVVAVLVSDGAISHVASGGMVEPSLGIGSFVVLPAGESAVLRNPGGGEISVAFVELR